MMKELNSVWELSAKSLEPYYHSYLGNGYLGVQMSQDGTGGVADPPGKKLHRRGV